MASTTKEPQMITSSLANGGRDASAG
jgi:hypothetical protein